MNAKAAAQYLLAGVVWFVLVSGPIYVAAAAMDQHRHWSVSILGLYLLFEVGAHLARLARRSR